MVLFLDNPTGHLDTVKQSQVQSYNEEVLCAGWNPALNELRACLGGTLSFGEGRPVL